MEEFRKCYLSPKLFQIYILQIGFHSNLDIIKLCRQQIKEEREVDRVKYLWYDS